MRAIVAALLAGGPLFGFGQGIGDPTFPNLGNKGYLASNYSIHLNYNPDTNRLRGDVTMTAKATAAEDSISLDFSGFEVSAVKVDGQPATFNLANSKLVVKPAAALTAGQEFSVETIYEGNPAQAVSASLFGLSSGWVTYPGGSVTVCEPDLAHTWFPCNDHPLNKATFDFQIETPAGYRVICNGVKEKSPDDKPNLSIWHMSKPMQTCMAIVAIGKYEVSDQTGPDSLWIRNYFPASDKAKYEEPLSHDPEFLKYLSDRLGLYPYDTYGTIELPGAVSTVCQVLNGSALETVSIPVFSPDSAENLPDLIHEMCHQWMGDCVSVTNWGDDLWWVEGFATYSQYMLVEMTQGREAYDQQMKGMYDNLAARPEWLKPGHLTAKNLFSEATYQGGCMVFHALRVKVGDDLFFKSIRKYISDHKYGNGSTEALIQAFDDTTGQDMHPFFKAWLYGDTIPKL
jgi:aminopeptidase N